jgi:FMN phosphatase YigB (HAD superfamily)
MAHDGRKPEPAFYLLACERNGLQPGQIIFLDDIGMCVQIPSSVDPAIHHFLLL